MTLNTGTSSAAPVPASVPAPVGGGAPVRLPRGASAWQLRDGTAEAHLVWSGGRRLLMELTAGDCVFGVDDADIHIDLIAGATADFAQIARPGEAPLIDVPTLAAAAERWISACARRLDLSPADGTVRPDDGSDWHSVSGDLLTAETPVWAAPGQGVSLSIGSAAPAIPGDVLPVATGLPVRANGAGTVRRITSAVLAVDGRLLPAVAEFTASLTGHFDGMIAQADRADLARLGTLADAPPATEQRDVDTAVRTIARALGLTPDAATGTGAVGGTFGGTDLTAVPARARTAGLRARKIALDTGWHRVGDAPLIVRDGAGQVLALTWQGRRYADATGRIITGAIAAEFEPLAYALSGPLPARVQGVWSMALFAMQGNRPDAMAALASAAAMAVLGTLVPLATAWLLSDIVPAGLTGLLISVGIALVLAAVITAVLSTARAMATSRISGRGAVRLDSGLTDRLLRLPTGFFHDFSAGDLNQRIENVSQIRELAVSVVMSAGLTAVLSIAYLIVMFAYDAQLGLIALALVSVYVLAVIVARVLQMEAIREAAALDGRIAGLVYETLEAVPKLRASAAEGRAMERWAALYHDERMATVRAGRVSTNFAAFASAYQTITLLCLFAGAGALAAVDAPTGVFIGFLAAFGTFQSAFVGLSEQLLQVYAAQPLVERALPILTAEPEGQAGQTDPGQLSGEIEGSGLAFSYAEGQPPVLNGLSFRVLPGQHMAIVGASGSGKSTVLRLLLGFEKPDRGSLTFDGQDLTHLDLSRVRAQIGVVLQSSKLFAGSILENIRGAGAASLEDCMAAADAAGLTPDLETFAMGLHTPITEGAGTLSGGQRQRILIARALASKPRMLFFDEATSALDNATQSVVAQTLDAMKMTRVTIAHRLSTVRNADMICVLDGGRFAEIGSYEDLMERGGLFARLARRQLTED